jgi:hypothetical protein
MRTTGETLTEFDQKNGSDPLRPLRTQLAFGISGFF